MLYSHPNIYQISLLVTNIYLSSFHDFLNITFMGSIEVTMNFTVFNEWMLWDFLLKNWKIRIWTLTTIIKGYHRNQRTTPYAFPSYSHRLVTKFSTLISSLPDWNHPLRQRSNVVHAFHLLWVVWWYSWHWTRKDRGISQKAS